MRIFKYFWVLFALYFIIAHPAIIYYGNHLPSFLEQRSPTHSLIYLAIAVIGWITVLAYGWAMIYKNTFGIRNGIRQLSKTGKLVNAKIITVNTQKSALKEFENKEIVVSFDNFSNTRITYTLILTDTKPHLNRYEEGKMMTIRIDPDVKYLPYVVPADVEAKIKYQKTNLLFGLWTMALLGVVGYFIYAYISENQGYGWRFLTWQHPLMMSLMMVLALGLIYYLINKLILSKIAGVMSRKVSKLLFYGEQTTAMVLEVSQTGTYINEQPEVRFEMTFVDKKGVKHQVSIKKIVSLINLQVVHQKAKSIFYLPDSPTTIAFEEDLKATF